MTDSKMEALARQLVASPHWSWIPGMRTIDGRRVMVEPGRHLNEDAWADISEVLPDLSDPATLGCLLALVREAWGDDGCLFSIHIGRTDECVRCSWSGAESDDDMEFGTEAEALVAALLAAPEAA